MSLFCLNFRQRYLTEWLLARTSLLPSALQCLVGAPKHSLGAETANGEDLSKVAERVGSSREVMEPHISDECQDSFVMGDEEADPPS